MLRTVVIKTTEATKEASLSYLAANIIDITAEAKSSSCHRQQLATAPPCQMRIMQRDSLNSTYYQRPRVNIILFPMIYPIKMIETTSPSLHLYQ